MATNKPENTVGKTSVPVGVPQIDTIPTVGPSSSSSKMINHNLLAKRGLRKKADISAALRKLKGGLSDLSLRKLNRGISKNITGLEWRAVGEGNGGLWGHRLTPNVMYNPQDIHLRGRTPGKDFALNLSDYLIPAATTVGTQGYTGGILQQPNESLWNYVRRTGLSAGLGSISSPRTWLTVLKRAKFTKGKTDNLSAFLSGSLKPLGIKLGVTATTALPYWINDMVQGSHAASGTAQNLNEGTKGLDLTGAFNDFGSGMRSVGGLSNSVERVANIMEDATKAQAEAEKLKADKTKEMVDSSVKDVKDTIATAAKPVGDLANTLNRGATYIGDNWPWMVGVPAAGVGSYLLIKRLMEMRENAAKDEARKKMFEASGGRRKKRKLTIDPGDYDFEIKNLEVKEPTV